MTRKILMLTVAAAFTTASGLAFAQGANGGPKYPNMESHKQYTDKRNLDHNNAAPRYPVMTSNKQYTDKRNLDHNNAAPRYAVTTSSQQAPNARVSATRIRPGQRVIVRHSVRYPVHASHRAKIYASHG